MLLRQAVSRTCNVVALFHEMVQHDYLEKVPCTHDSHHEHAMKIVAVIKYEVQL